jgi:WD40 repeat protein
LNVFQLNQGGGDKEPWRTFGSSAPRESIPWLTFGTDNETYPVSKEGRRVPTKGDHRSPDGNWAAWSPAGQNSVILLHDVVADRAHEPIKASSPLATPLVLAWSHDSKAILSAEHDGKARLFELTTGKERSFTELQGNASLCGVALSPDRQTLAVATGNHVFWYDVASTKRKQLLENVQALRIAYSRDGKLFAASSHHKVTVWDADAVVAHAGAAPLAAWPTPGPLIELAF